MGMMASQGIQSLQQESINSSRAAMQNDLSSKITDYNSMVGPLTQDELSMKNTWMDQLQALNAGINPSLLSGPSAALTLAPFQQQRQIFEMRQNMIDYTIQNEQARAGFNNRMFQNYVSNPLYQMGPGYEGVTNDTFFKFMSGR